MIFRRNKEGAESPAEAQAVTTEPSLVVVAPKELFNNEEVLSAIAQHAEGLKIVPAQIETLQPAVLKSARAVLSVFQDNAALDKVLELLLAERNARKDGLPVLIVAAELGKLTQLGHWLYLAGSQERLNGVRLIVASEAGEIAAKLDGKFAPVTEPNVIKMPSSPEVECTDFKYYFCITPELRSLVRTMRELAENSVTRVYLLGGPGTGKTTIAYYYFLCRGKGNFVTVNLTAESTGDKESMKSLLCGHVTGAIAGGGAREGALAHAGEGVAFLDESHGVTGTVMQVLMEVLDSGQFLPFGAVKKRALQCAVIFASNRSWEALRNLMNLDEHARLGATIVRITDLAVREEDMIAVLSTTLAKFSKQCVTWKAPEGLTAAAWKAYKDCKWHGNTRTLIRVTEASSISYATKKQQTGLIDAPHVNEALSLWEPTEHDSLQVYTSFTTSEG
ncbi:MAG: sigma 54-interacting transcriptional regulator [Bdellovibrionota bacterium]